MDDPGVTTVADLIRERGRSDPSRGSLVGVDGATVATAVELSRWVTHIASQLSVVGVSPGMPVLVSIPNGAAALAAILASMTAGAAAPMNPAYTIHELEQLAGDINPVGAVVARHTECALRVFAERRRLPIVEVDGEPPDVDIAFLGRAPVASDVALVLHTAGTTALPKQVPLTHANLLAATGNVVRSLALTSNDRCLNVMPLFHSHGLIGAALSSLRAGASIVCAPTMDDRRFLQWASATQSTWYTAAPTIHQLVVDAPGNWGGFRFIRSASAPLPPSLAHRLEERFDATLVEVYGMTEAYQIAANPLGRDARRLGSVGRATGTQIKITDPNGAPLDAGRDGEVLVCGAAVFAGYSSPVDANLDAFHDGWFRTGDLGNLSVDGFLTITGRLKEQINRGGQKVSPREIDEAVLAHPDVHEAMAFPVPDSELGEEVGVAVVAKHGREPDAVSVRAFLRGRIAPFKVPRYVVVVDELPKSSTGKPLRLGFAESHADELMPVGVSSEDPDLQQGGSIESHLAVLWMEVLELSTPPAPNDRFFDLGGTSLAAMELVNRVLDVLGLDLPVVDVIDVPSLRAMAEYLEGASGVGDRRPLLRPYRPRSHDTSVILIPGQYGMAVGLDLIAEAIDAPIDIFLFDYPGNRPGETPLGSVEGLARLLVSEIQRADITDDILLYGNSLGGWVAFEAARLLDRMGRRPLLVCIGDMYSPVFNSSQSPLRPPLVRLIRNRARRVLRDVRARRTRPSAQMSPALLRQDEVMRASDTARRSYAAHPYEGDLLVVVAEERGPKYGQSLGWEQHVSGSISSIAVSGGHGNMHRDEAATIGRALSVALQPPAL